MKYLLYITSFTFISLLPLSANDNFGHTGRLVDSNGAPITGTPDLRFELYYSDQTGSNDWICEVEIPDVSLNNNGIYFVELDFSGSCDLNDVIGNIPTGESLLLRTHDLTNQLSFDFQNILNMPMSYYARYAEEANTVTDESITADKLDQMGAATGQILKWTGSEWAPADDETGEDGTVTSVNAGDGLTVTGSATDPIVSIADGGVTEDKIADEAVTPAKIPYNIEHFDGANDRLNLLLGDGIGSDGSGIYINVDGASIEISGSGLQLTDTGAAGTHTKVTVDDKGRVTAGTTLDASDIPDLNTNKITSGVFDMARLNTGTGSGQLILLDGNERLPALDGSQLYNLPDDHFDGTSAGGDLTGTYPDPELADVVGLTPGDFTKVTVDSKGRVISGGSLGPEDLPYAEALDTQCVDGDFIQADDGKFVCTTAGSGDGDFMSDGSIPMTGGLQFESDDGAQNFVEIRAPELTADFALILPSDAGSDGDVLSVNSVGELGWISPSTGSVTNVTAGAPLDSTETDTPHITIERADSSTDGYLSSTDWETFNNKQDALVTGDLTESTSSVLTISGGDDSVIGSGIEIEVARADGSSSGYLHQDDWSEFNNKEDALPIGGDSTHYLDGDKTWQTLNTNAVAELGNLYFTDERAQDAAVIDSTAGSETDRAPSVSAIKDYISGELSSASDDYLLLDGTQAMEGTLNLGENNLRFENPTHNIELQVPATIIDNYTLILPGNEGASGQVLSTDGSGTLSWVSPEEGTVTEVSGTGPIGVSDGTSTPVVSISQADGSSDGYLSSTDWENFNSKEDALPIGGDSTHYLDGDKTWQTLNTNAVAELGNLYFTDERAQDAAVVDSTVGNETDQAPSVAAIKSYLSDELSSASDDYLLLDGTQAMTGTLSLDDNRLRFGDDTNHIELRAPASLSGNHLFTLPEDSGLNGQVLKTDGNGVLSWDNSEEGTVTEVSGDGPISVSDGTTTPQVSISQANDSTDGYLSSTDWETFNNKQDELTTGDLSESTSSVLTITGGDDSVIGSGVNIEVQRSSTTEGGYLHEDDFNIFNNKQDSLNFGSATSTDFLDGDNNWRELTSGDIPDLSANKITSDVLDKDRVPSAESLNTSCANGETIMSNGSDFNCTASTEMGNWNLNGNDVYYNSGNVGIGTMSPVSSLHLDGIATVGSGAIPNPDANSVLRFPARGQEGDHRNYIELQGVYSNDANNVEGGAFIKFRTSTSANYGPEIGAVRSTSDNGNGDFLIKTGGNDVQERFRIINSGNVGIGTTSPSERLEVAGCIKHNNGTLGSSCSSDERLKDDIKDVDFGSETLANFLNLRPRKYVFKTDYSSHYYGLIAQEVEQVEPSLVGEENEDGYMTVDYEGAKWMHFKATQELIRENIELKEEINDLKERLEKIEQALADN